MKMKTIATAIIAVSLATSGLAYGQNYGERNDQRNDQRGDQRNDQRGDQQQRPDRGHRSDRGMRDEQYRDQRGAGPEHTFYRGQRLPPEYHNRQYVVDDWRGHHLSAPPRGYHWVQTGGDYVLVAITTGIILQVLLGN
ncbi:RcnB family protein [Collimonas arenae]|uniref:RcnB family protein n=1 Tax=Collimonas arenae TaxID=279058 RepID=UPI00077823CD|nr:RcnB family protein [Collimonas arenae]